MTHFLRPLAVLAAAMLTSCVTSRSSFAPDSGPPTVGMPAKLSDRERTFVSELDSTLRSEGYVPVRNGAGDMQLEFEIAEGPINTDTSIELYENRRLLAEGKGRAAGAPMIGRAKVAEKSFNRAFEQFRSALPSGSSARSGRSRDQSDDRGAGDEQYVY